MKKLQLGIGSRTYFWVTLKNLFTQSTILGNCFVRRIGDGRRFHQDVPLGIGSDMDHKLVDLVMG